MSWSRLRVDYHDGSMDDLILDALRPAWRDGTRAYFTRHWLRGPHLRVAVDGDTAETVRAVRAHLARHPSPSTTDPATLLPLHERLAELEGVRGSVVTPWEEDNTITPGQEESGGELPDFLAGFYADSTGQAFDALARVRAGAALPSIAFDLLIATAHELADGGLSTARASLRSHAEAYLARHEYGDAVRERWRAQYAAGRQALTARVAAVAGGGRPAGIPEWLGLISDVRDRGRVLVDAGRIELGYADAARAPDLPALTEVSPFHRALEEDERWLALRDSPAFAAYRLALNCSYLHLTRLGLSPDRRFLLCWMAAEAADELVVAR